MKGIIRNFVGIKVICHFLLTGIWIYWGIYVQPLTSGWIGWSLLIGGGILYFIVGGICLIADHELDINVDFLPWWAFGHSLTNMFLLGVIMYHTGLYPENPYILLWPAIFATTTLLLYWFNGFESASLLIFITISLWLSNWGINRWYDYCILIVAIIIAFFSIIVSSFKYDEDAVSDALFHLINIGLCSLVNIGLLSLLYFNGLFSIDNFYNISYITIGIVLFWLVVSNRLITMVLLIIAGVIYWWKNTGFTFSSLIPDLSFEWLHSTWFQVAVWIVGGILALGLIGYIIYKLIPAKIVYVKPELPPMEIKGLCMTCPRCRNMTHGKYDESAMRGIVKTVAKKGVTGGWVAAWATAGSVLGPIGAIAGALGGGVVTYYYNKKIDKGVEAAMDLWDYEMKGARKLNFECDNCGHKWEETETYGKINIK